MMDVILGFIDQHAGTAQVLIAFVLLVVTYWYARSAHHQVKEADKSRHTALQPHVHIVSADLEPKHGDQSVVLKIVLRNVGPGPALGVRLLILSELWPFQSNLSSLDLDAHEVSKELRIGARGFRLPPPGQPASNQIYLRAEYWDIFRRFWKTTTRIGIENLNADEGDPSFGRVAFTDVERVDRIDHLYIDKDSDEIRRDLEVGVMTTK
jgi:hypothetical protein